MNFHSITGDDEGVEDDGLGTLANIEFDGSRFVSADDIEAVEDREKRDRFRATVERIATADRFHDVVRLVYRWTGRALKVRSLEIGENNEDFREACDFLYDDLKDGILGPIIDDLDTDTLHRLLVYGAGFGAPVLGAVREISERKREAKDAPVPEDDNETQEGDDDENAS